MTRARNYIFEEFQFWTVLCCFVVLRNRRTISEEETRKSDTFIIYPIKSISGFSLDFVLYVWNIHILYVSSTIFHTWVENFFAKPLIVGELWQRQPIVSSKLQIKKI